jgi:CheY-like chemotaxis protein
MSGVAASEITLKDATVLLVEDDAVIRLTTTVMLTDIGCKVKQARTAEEALKIVDECLRQGLEHAMKQRR